MIRNRLKKKVRKLAIKAFGMEFDTEDRDPNAGGRADPADFDPSVIPNIVDGAGDKACSPFWMCCSVCGRNGREKGGRGFGGVLFMMA